MVALLARGGLLGATLRRYRLLVSWALPPGAREARRLEVYVATHCVSCVEARRLAAAAAWRFPGLDVRTIVVDADGDRSAQPDTGRSTALPERVVAVPAYLLDGTVIALGNPDPEQLFARIAAPSQLARPA